MPLVSCCTFRRHPSPDLQNIRFVDASRDKSATLLRQSHLTDSETTVQSSKTGNEVQEIRKLVASSAQIMHGCGTSVLQIEEDKPAEGSATPAIHKTSNNRLSAVIRKRLSRDSGVSSQSSKSKTRTMHSEEDLERRKELKRALHRRLQSEILEDKTASEGGYDSDAEPIKTPRTTRSRACGALELRSNDLGDFIRRLEAIQIEQGSSPTKEVPSFSPLMERGPNAPDSPVNQATDQREKNKSQKTETFQGSTAIGKADLRRELHGANQDNYTIVSGLAIQRSDTTIQHVNSGGSAEVEKSPPQTKLDISALESRPVAQITGSVTRPQKWISASSLLVPEKPLVLRLDTIETNNGDRDRTDEKSHFGGVDGEGCVAPIPKFKDTREESKEEQVARYRPAKPIRSNQLASAGFKNVAGNCSSSRASSDQKSLVEGPIHRNNSSSVYPSRGCSLASSPGGSFSHFVSATDQGLQTSDSSRTGASRLNAQHSLLEITNDPQKSEEQSDAQHWRRRTIDTTSFQSSTASFRAQELAAADLRFADKQRSCTLPISSRFTEELEDISDTVVSLGRNFTRSNKKEKSSHATHDGSDEWFSSGKRQGYGYSFVSQPTEYASEMWERALQDHAEEFRKSEQGNSDDASNISGKQPARTSSTGGKSKNTGIVLIRTESESAIDPKHSKLLSSGGAGSIAPSEMTRASAGRKPLPASWSRYPSYSRAERSLSPAGRSERVEARDFAERRIVTGSPTPIRGRVQSLRGRKKKSRSMTFGRNVFKSWKRIYKTQSTDLKAAARSGYRSSISPGGVVEFPELELLPADTLSDTLVSPYLGGTRNRPSSQSEGASTIASQEIHGTTVENTTPRDAKIWSRLYEECVQYPASVLVLPLKGTDRSSSLHPSSACRRNETHASSNPSITLRDSTLNFQQSLKVDEVRAKEEILRAAEVAWGT
ncbi:hypothetical protein MMC09_005377 [Bachmanniomyces sp. S44760]|nr:hypothetical protein [Bachmanniomyces sp. S44760]